MSSGSNEATLQQDLASVERAVDAQSPCPAQQQNAPTINFVGSRAEMPIATRTNNPWTEDRPTVVIVAPISLHNMSHPDTARHDWKFKRGKK